ELTERISIDKANTTRAIKKLEETGYIEMKVNEQDKRKYHIFLTEKALVAKDEILAISFRWNDHLVGMLSQDELDTLYILLRKIARNNPGYFFEEEEKLNS
ncbi:MAG: MarR family transcriptional regulator, partial [Niameybacter sp.]